MIDRFTMYAEAIPLRSTTVDVIARAVLNNYISRHGNTASLASIPVSDYVNLFPTILLKPSLGCKRFARRILLCCALHTVMWHLVHHWIFLSLGTFRWFPAGTLKLAELRLFVNSISTVLQAPRARQLLERVSLRGVSQVEPHLVRFVVYSIIPFKLAHWANYNSVLFYSTKLRVSFILSSSTRTIDSRNASYSPPIVSNPWDYNISIKEKFNAIYVYN
jgi:hypothetical protein